MLSQTVPGSLDEMWWIREKEVSLPIVGMDVG